MTRDDVIEAIHAERQRQIDKWGSNDSPDDPWIAILGEEFGEVCQAFLEIRHGQSVEYLKEELIQVAAVAVKWLEVL